MMMMMMMMDELTLTWHIVLRLQGHVTVKKSHIIVAKLASIYTHCYLNSQLITASIFLVDIYTYFLFTHYNIRPYFIA